MHSCASLSEFLCEQQVYQHAFADLSVHLAMVCVSVRQNLNRIVTQAMIDCLSNCLIGDLWM